MTGVRLTNDPAESYCSSQAVGAASTNVHVVWTDNRTGDWEIFYKHSGNNGSTWMSDQQLTFAPGMSDVPSIVVSGQYLHVLWVDIRMNSSGVFYKRSTSNGTSWGADTRISINNPTYCYMPAAATAGTNVYVVYSYIYNQRDAIFYVKSPTNGSNWQTETKLSSGAEYSWLPTIGASGSYVHVAWVDTRDGNWEIYHNRSTNGGSNWSGDTRLTDNPARSNAPSIAVFVPYVHITWSDDRDGNNEIYYQRSTNGGASWLTAVRLTNNSAASQSPRITISGALVHVVWYDNRDGNDELYYKRSTNYGQSWGTDTRITGYSGSSVLPSIITNGAYIHVAWRDDHDGNTEIYYKQNPTGNSIGVKKISTEVPVEYSLSQNCPNPFNPVTKIRFALPQSSFVNLSVYDIMGRIVETLANEQLTAGSFEADFNARDLASGVYFYKMISENFTATRKMIVIK